MAQTIFCDVPECTTPADVLVQMITLGQIDAFCFPHYALAVQALAAQMTADAEAEAAEEENAAASLYAAENGLDGADEPAEEGATDDATAEIIEPAPPRGRGAARAAAVGS